jgi:hypothetical protein
MLKLGLILISYVFNSKVFLFKLQKPKFFFTILFWLKNLSFLAHSISATRLISTIVFDPNTLWAQLVTPPSLD